jgi:hypothetical protein
MRQPRPAPGGGTAIDVAPDRLVAWVTRFGARNDGLVDLRASPHHVDLVAGDGTGAVIAVPYGPMNIVAKEPIEAVLDHVREVGTLGMLLVRAGAYSIGTCANRTVQTSTTDRQYVQGRTAAGGQSQQRFARRRSNQRRAAYDAAADAAARMLAPTARTLRGLVLGGDRGALTAVLADPRLAALHKLPSRTMLDVPEPRRAVLDDVAERSLDVTITIYQPDQPGGHRVS